MRPGIARLPVQLPIALGNGLRIDDAIALLQSVALRKILADEFGVDGGVDDDVRHVYALRTEFARHALRERAQAVLGAGERREAVAAAHAGRGAGKKNRTARPR